VAAWQALHDAAIAGFHEYDNDKLASWRYRDYLIRAFNDDLPYHQFLREHIAGDQLPQPRLSKDGTFVESILPAAFFSFGDKFDPSPTASTRTSRNCFIHPASVHDLHATMLHLLGLDHKKLTYRFGGRDMWLTDVHGERIKPVLA
jgi:hypothetical protein